MPLAESRQVCVSSASEMGPAARHDL